MKRDLNVIASIMREKDKEIEKQGARELDPEEKAMAAHKRFTFDIVEIPFDPLR